MPSPIPCPTCAKRIPYGLDKCIGCGSTRDLKVCPVERRGRRRRSLVISLALATVLGLLAFNFSDRYVPAVADWYADMVIRYLPDSAMRYTATGDDQQAFFVCARGVVKRIEADASIATFASGGSTERLEEGRFRVQSYFDEALEDGAQQRHLFSCTVRQEGRKWVLEELVLQAINPAVPDRRASVM